MREVSSFIKQRRSVRTFNAKALSKEDAAKIREYIRHIENPFGNEIEFRLLDAREHDLSSVVISGTDTYIAAKAKRVKHFEIAYGYCFEKLCLYALSCGLGTVMLAATISRQSFEKAMEVKPDEVMPLASPIGYAADKMSLREKMMRKSIKADERFPFESLFFEQSFDKPLAKSDGVLKEALEMLRLAPSAANKQPWRAVVDGNTVHFYENKSMKESALGDVQKVDIGIGLAHFDLFLQEQGIACKFFDADPGISHPENVEYMISAVVSLADEPTACDR